MPAPKNRKRSKRRKIPSFAFDPSPLSSRLLLWIA
jgi:hypothetical protein